MWAAADDMRDSICRIITVKDRSDLPFTAGEKTLLKCDCSEACLRAFQFFQRPDLYALWCLSMTLPFSVLIFTVSPDEIFPEIIFSVI